MKKPTYQITPRCCGCGRCAFLCPEKAIRKVAAAKRYEIDQERCRACGKCNDGCPQNAIICR